MRMSRVSKKSLFLTLLILSLVWGHHLRRAKHERELERERQVNHQKQVERKIQLEDERGKLRLTGTWMLPVAGNPTFHVYMLFNRDGTGEEIIEIDGKRLDMSLTYTLKGTLLDITCEWTDYGGEVVRWDDPRISMNTREYKVQGYCIHFDTNAKRIHIDRYIPHLSPEVRVNIYWKRVTSKKW